MRVGINGMMFDSHQPEGRLTYAWELLWRLARQHPQDTYHYFFQSLRRKFLEVPLPGDPAQAERSVLRVPIRGPARVLERCIYGALLPAAMSRRRLDLFHGLALEFPRPGKTYRTIVTVHDVFPRSFPTAYSDSKGRRYSDKWHSLAAAHADQLIAVSNTTGNELIRHYGVSGDRVRVIHEAAGEQFRPLESAQVAALVRAKYRLPPRYVLGVGSANPRKTPEVLLQAFTHVAKVTDGKIGLVLFGGGNGIAGRYGPMARALGIEKTVRFLGNVPQGDLPAIYSLAEVFAFPSLYEGFGLPVLEAMQCGTAVITSGIGATAEVAQDAAKLVDPKSSHEVGQAILDFILDPERLTRFVQLGLERAKLFSWDLAARQTHALYEEVLGRAR